MFKRYLILWHNISVYLMLNLWVKFRLGNINQGNIDLWGFTLESHRLELHFKTYFGLVSSVALSLHVTTKSMLFLFLLSFPTHHHDSTLSVIVIYMLIMYSYCMKVGWIISQRFKKNNFQMFVNGSIIKGEPECIKMNVLFG